MIEPGANVGPVRQEPSIFGHTRWFKYDRDYLCVNKSQFVPVIFEPPCTLTYNFPCLCVGNFTWNLFRHFIQTLLPIHVCERERETETERECVCVCVCVCMLIYLNISSQYMLKCFNLSLIIPRAISRIRDCFHNGGKKVHITVLSAIVLVTKYLCPFTSLSPPPPTKYIY
jgi:hypothetical protein